MCLLDYLFGKDRSRARDRGSQRPSDAQPPYDLLDRHYRLPDGLEVNVIGFQYGGKLLRIPFVVRCRVSRTQETVLIDPSFVRRFGTEITPTEVRLETLPKPYVVNEDEVLQIIGWSFENGIPIQSHLIRIADEKQGEGGVR